MENFKIINNNELATSVEQINPAKKLKTRSHDFSNILKAGKVVEPKVESTIKEDISFGFDIPKTNINSNLEKEYTSPVKEEKPEVPAYNAIKEEEIIDLKHIKDLESSYKGHRSVRETEKIEKKASEKAEEEVITEEMFRAELEKADFSQEASNFKENLANQYNAIRKKIKDQKDKIDDITREYSQESERGNTIKEEKKDIQKVLNGMNTWQMEFFAKFKDEQRTKTLLSSIEDYFASYRKDLEEKIRAEKAGEERKESLGKAEQKAREDYSSCKKQLLEFIKKNYQTLKEVNRHDEVLRENDAELKSLTGAKDLDSLYLNSEKDSLRFNGRTTFGVNQPQREPVNAIPEINNGLNNIASSNDNKPNIFDVFRRAANDDQL